MIKSARQYYLLSYIDKIKNFVLIVMLCCFSTIGYSSKEVNYSTDPKEGAISYFIWLDLDENGQYDIGEQILKNITVSLFDASEDTLLRQFEILDEGRFYFKNLTKGSYYLELSFSEKQTKNFFIPLHKNEFQEGNDSSHFKTKTFLFDPLDAIRKNINIPFQNQEVISQDLKSITCSDFIDTSFIDLTIENCDNLATICIDEAIADMLSYDITDNGQPFMGLVSPCDFDTSYAYTYTSIPDAGLIGPYRVDVWTLDGIIFQGLVADMETLKDSMNTWDSVGDWTHDNLTSSIRGGSTLVNYSSIEITQVATNLSATMSLNTTLNPNGSQLSLEVGFHELVFTDPGENCTDTIEVMINCIPCEVVYDDIITFDLDDCNDNQSVCFDISNEEWSEYTVSDNGLAYNGSANPCSIDSFYQYNYSGMPGGGTFGPYLLQNWTVDGTIYLGGFNNVGDLVDSMNVWDIGGNWEISDPAQTITGGHSEKNYGDIEVLQILTNTTGTSTVEKLASINSMEIAVDSGFHQLVFFNTNNQCTDTIDLTLACSPCPEYLADTLINIVASHCDSSSLVCLPIPFSEVDDYSISLNGMNYTEGFESCSDMSSAIFLDTGIYEILLSHNITGCLDSGTIAIDCIPPTICNDFISEELIQMQINNCDSSSTFCVEIPFVEILDYTITQDGDLYEGSFEACNVGTSLTIRPGFHEFKFINNISACSDSVNVMLVCLEPETITMNITVGELDTICIDTSSLIGYLASFNNFCLENAGEMAIVETLPNTNCLVIEGVESGIEQACIEVCDNYGFCDTTFINIEVEPLIIEPDLEPIANDDLVQIEQENKINILVLENDEWNGTLNSFGVLESPAHGTAIIIDNTTIEYTPDPEYCTTVLPDSFVYVICNDTGCDEATVQVWINCKDILVYNAFSPNGDGQNEYFVINGAPNKPNNSLSVFNRYGGRVYFSKGYQNDWDGTWEGQNLPDGTYFYLFEDGTGSTASGYVQIQR